MMLPQIFTNADRFTDHKHRLRIMKAKFHSDVYVSDKGRLIYTITLIKSLTSATGHTSGAT